MLFKWPVAKQWEQTFVKGIEAHADSSIAQTARLCSGPIEIFRGGGGGGG